MNKTNLKAFALLDRNSWINSHPSNAANFSDLPDVVLCDTSCIEENGGIYLSNIVGYNPNEKLHADRLVISNRELSEMFAYIKPTQYVFRFHSRYEKNRFLNRYSSVPEFASLPDVFVIQHMYFDEHSKQRIITKIAGWDKPVRHIIPTIFTDEDIILYMDQLNTYPNGYSEEATPEPEAVPEKTQNLVEEVTVNVNHIIDLSTVYKTAKSVKPRTKESVALHLGSEAGEINECLVQPQRGGNIVEESVDAILCAFDLIYLELGQTHGTHEISRVIQRLIETKCAKWAETCKR